MLELVDAGKHVSCIVMDGQAGRDRGECATAGDRSGE